MPQVAAYRGVVLLLWALAAYATVTCRGLFWDGSSFLVNILDLGWFHDFYVARAHVDWLTQAPVLLLSRARACATPGCWRWSTRPPSSACRPRSTTWPWRACARDAVLLGIVIAVIATVYLPTCFFIVGEYNATFAAVTAAHGGDADEAREAAGRCRAAVPARRVLRSAPTRR